MYALIKLHLLIKMLLITNGATSEYRLYIFWKRHQSLYVENNIHSVALHLFPI